MTDESTEITVQVHLAEYNAIRAEIIQNLQLQTVYMTLAVILSTAIVALKLYPPLTFLFLVLAIAFPGLLYCDAEIRTLRCADYIETHLQTELVRLGCGNAVLHWEGFIRGEHTRRSHLGHKGAFFQGILFLMPALICLGRALFLIPKQLGVLYILFWTLDLATLLWFGVGLYKVSSRDIQSVREQLSKA